MPNYIVLGIYFIFVTKFSWNEGIDTCFNMQYVLFSRNVLGGYLVIAARYLVVTGGYCLHGTIIRAGIACKKIPCYMRDSACRWFIVKNARIF